MRVLEDTAIERPIDDLIGEALRRHRHGDLRPLWRDMPEGDNIKELWRGTARNLLTMFDKVVATK